MSSRMREVLVGLAACIFTALGLVAVVSDASACDLVNCSAECYSGDQQCDDDCVALFYTVDYEGAYVQIAALIYRKCSASGTWEQIAYLPGLMPNVENLYVDDPPDGPPLCRGWFYKVHVICDSGEMIWDDVWYSPSIYCN